MFNKKLISKVIGSLLVLEASFMLLCVVTALFYGSNDVLPFAVSFLITLGAGMGLMRLGHEAPTTMARRDAYIVVTFTWVTFSIFGSLPYLFGGFFGSFEFFDIEAQIVITTDAFFETMSGFTTTGASMLNDVEAQLESHHAMLAWRSLSQWIGGLGIVFFTIAIVFQFLSGINFSMLFMVIWWVYILLTIGCGVCYALAGMDGFSAVNYAMTTTATGGFSIHNDSFSNFQSPSIDYIAILFEFLAGINFTLLYITIFKARFKDLFKNSEFKLYIGIVLLATASLVMILFTQMGYDLEKAFRTGLFQVVSFMTTTGVFSDDVALWPHITWIILGGVMFIGACAGSTSGGFKCIRAVMTLKTLRNNFRQILHPNAVLPVKINGSSVPQSRIVALFAFFTLFMCMILVTAAIMILSGIDAINSIVIALSCVSNIGPTLSNDIGANITWSGMPDYTKWILSLLMLMGRLEIMTVLVLFTPSFWRDN